MCTIFYSLWLSSVIDLKEDLKKMKDKGKKESFIYVCITFFYGVLFISYEVLIRLLRMKVHRKCLKELGWNVIIMTAYLKFTIIIINYVKKTFLDKH